MVNITYLNKVILHINYYMSIRICIRYYYYMYLKIIKQRHVLKVKQRHSVDY